MEKAFVKRVESKCAAEAEMRQQMMVERRKTNRSTRCQSANSEGPLQMLYSRIVAKATEMYEWRGLASQVVEELNVAQAHVALQLAL